MLFMVELHYAEQHRDEALRFFWQHGATGHPGSVALKELWVSTQDRVAYALVDAPDQAQVAQAGKPLEPFGKLTIRQVTSVDEI